MRALLERSGFRTLEAWTRRAEHRLTPETLLERKASRGFGARYHGLADSARRAMLAKTQARWRALDAEAFLFQPNVIYAIAERR